MTSVQNLGALGFGIIIGWYTYYVNRYRRDDIKLADIATILGAIGGGAVLALFPAKSDLFGWYGVGLFVGFFGYLLILGIIVATTSDFDRTWFLDGRKKVGGKYVVPSGTSDRPMVADSSNNLVR